MTRCWLKWSLVLMVLAGFVCTASAQQPAAGAPAAPPPAARPAAKIPLFFSEEWKQPTIPSDSHGAWAATAEPPSNPRLDLRLYGPSRDRIQLSGILKSDTNPLNLWTGLATTPMAAALRDKENFVDLTGRAKIRWVTRTSGFHVVRPLVKLADGSWFVGDPGSGTPADFNDSEVSISELRWTKLDIERVVTVGRFVPTPDLSRVDEVGFADLLPGSGNGPGGWVNVSRIEVYGKPVKR
jgi:hypothetical protein